MPAPSASSFPLASSPWLPVLDLDTRAERHVGLTEALTRAHRLRLSLPEQDEPAVLRLLLAVLDAACGPDTPAAWDAAWAAPRLPAGPVTAYLDQWADRLDLFHPEHPVFQCAGLTPNRGAQSLDPVSLSGSGGGFWSDALLAAGPPHPYRPWTPAEAVVRLLWLHAYDVGGIKTAAPGDPAGKGSKVYGALPGPIAQVTHLHLTVRRGTLKDDLLINLPPQPRAPGDAPVWEQDPAPVPVRERTPLGRLDRWTWPARRILLHTGGDGMVTGLALHDGDRLPKNHDDGLIASLDPLTGWQTTAKGRPWPLQVLNPAGFHLPWHTARLLDPHDPQGLASGVVTHAVAAAERGALAADTVIHVSTGTTQHTNQHRSVIYTCQTDTARLATARQLATPEARLHEARRARYADVLQKNLRGCVLTVTGWPPATIVSRLLLSGLDSSWADTVRLADTDPQAAAAVWDQALSAAADHVINTVGRMPDTRKEQIRAQYRTWSSPTAPRSKGGRPAARTYPAFGGTYSLSQISRMPQCTLSYITLRKRVEAAEPAGEDWTAAEIETIARGG